MMNIHAKVQLDRLYIVFSHKKISLLYLHKSNSRDVVLLYISMRLESEVSMDP